MKAPTYATDNQQCRKYRQRTHSQAPTTTVKTHDKPFFFFFFSHRRSCWIALLEHHQGTARLGTMPLENSLPHQNSTISSEIDSDQTPEPPRPHTTLLATILINSDDIRSTQVHWRHRLNRKTDSLEEFWTSVCYGNNQIERESAMPNVDRREIEKEKKKSRDTFHTKLKGEKLEEEEEEEKKQSYFLDDTTKRLHGFI